MYFVSSRKEWKVALQPWLTSQAAWMDCIWFCKKNVSVEKSTNRGSISHLTVEQQPDHLMVVEISLQQDPVLRVTGIKWSGVKCEKLVICRLTWPGFPLYLACLEVSLNLDKWNTLSAFLLISLIALLTLNLIISCNEQFCNLITCEQSIVTFFISEKLCMFCSFCECAVLSLLCWYLSFSGFQFLCLNFLWCSSVFLQYSLRQYLK